MSSSWPRSPDPLAPHRKRLLGLAYRMLGNRSDAEDIVQDAYLRFAAAENVGNAEALLVTIVTRLCLDQLKSARTQRDGLPPARHARATSRAGRSRATSFLPRQSCKAARRLL